MSTNMIVMGLILACGGAHQVSDSTRRFRVAVPELVGSGPVLLVLHDVTVPSNRPVTLRAYAVAPDSSRIFLGSSGLPGVSPDAKGPITRPMLRISVTAGLRRWAEAARGAQEADIEISPDVASDTASSHLSWSLRSVEVMQVR